MSDPSELLGIIDGHETAANAADDAYLEQMRRLGNFVEAVAHDRFALWVYTAGGENPEHASDASEARESASINYRHAVGAMDEAINARLSSLRASHSAGLARDSLLTSELSSDEAQLDD